MSPKTRGREMTKMKAPKNPKGLVLKLERTMRGKKPRQAKNIKRLKKIMEKKKLSNRHLGSIIDVDKTTIGAILQGKMPGIRIAAALYKWDSSLKLLGWFCNFKSLSFFDVRHYHL